MLRWHYRSRHHSLIAVSNREFYADQLFVVPSPAKVSAVNGLHFRHVEGGVFDRGEHRTNRVEAEPIAAGGDRPRPAIAPRNRWASAPSPSRSATPSATSSRSCSAQEPSLAEFFATGRPEPFFVKNLENIQGDERDVIFISVGYAPDASGYMAMNFGPLSIEGGERTAQRPDLARARALRGLQLDHGR